MENDLEFLLGRNRTDHAVQILQRRPAHLKDATAVELKVGQPNSHRTLIGTHMNTAY